MAADDPELVGLPDRLLLVTGLEIKTVAGIRIGEEQMQPAVHIGFDGRFNNSTETTSYWVAMSPNDALQFLANGIIDAIGNAIGEPHE